MTALFQCGNKENPETVCQKRQSLAKAGRVGILAALFKQGLPYTEDEVSRWLEKQTE